MKKVITLLCLAALLTSATGFAAEKITIQITPQKPSTTKPVETKPTEDKDKNSKDKKDKPDGKQKPKRGWGNYAM